MDIHALVNIVFAYRVFFFISNKNNFKKLKKNCCNTKSNHVYQHLFTTDTNLKSYYKIHF